MLIRSITILTLIFVTTFSYGQSRKKKKKSDRNNQGTEAPSALNPGQNQKEYAPRASKKSSKKTTYDAERNFYERMDELEKTKRKNEKLAEKPQYSDPMYFGHKRPPKKHKRGKLKYCKECGIRH